ncbi:MAG: energy transducer TonB [Chitinophagales bacterium]
MQESARPLPEPAAPASPPAPPPALAHAPAPAAHPRVESKDAGQALASFRPKVSVPAMTQIGLGPGRPVSVQVPAAQIATSPGGTWAAPVPPAAPVAAGAAPVPGEGVGQGASPLSAPASGSPASPARPARPETRPETRGNGSAPPEGLAATPAPAAGRPGYQPARLTRQVKPEYPLVARKKGLAGTVHLILQVGPDGRVGKVEVAESSGYPLLDDYAVAAARKWRYEPARDNGRPVAETKRVAVVFKLED